MNFTDVYRSQIPEYKVYVDDVLNYLNTTSDRFKLAFSDPPYEIDHLGGWDKSGIVYNPDLYKGLLRVLLPGAFLVFYGYSRTHHHVMTAMEDAGFILHKTMFAWVYTSGNPMGAPNLQRNVDNFYAKQYGGICKCEEPSIDEMYHTHAYINEDMEQFAFPIYLCQNCHKPIRQVLQEISWGETTGMKNIGGAGYGNQNKQIVAKSMTPEAELLKSYTYGLMWSKPMLEPIMIAQKPFDTKTTVEGILKYGTGVVNVHEARSTSRWPGNFIAIHDLGCKHNEDGSWECIDGCEIGEMIRQDSEFTEKIPTFVYQETDYSLASIDRMLYDSKPNKNERDSGVENEDNFHPSVKPISVNEYIGKLLLPPKEFGETCALNLFSGSGSEVVGLLKSGWQTVVGVEKDDRYAKMSLDRIDAHIPESVVCYYEDLN